MTGRAAVVLPYPHPGQRLVRHQARRFNWLAAGRRWRKTTLCMSIAVECAAAGQRVLWGAPVFDQVFVGWNEARRAVAGVAQLEKSRMTMRFPGGGAIVYRSLDDPDNARGHTADGVVIDECADVKPEAWYEVLRPMLIDTGGWAWGIGTPRGHNWFWEEFRAAHSRADAATWQIPTLGCALEEGRLVRRPHPLENPEVPFSEIAQLFDTQPESTFRQEILGEFVTAAYDTFDRDWWTETRFDNGDPRFTNAAVGRWLSADTAFSDSGAAAYTACVVGELAPDYRLLVREVWRERLTFPNLLVRLEATARRWNADGKLRGLVIEDKASGISATQTFRETAEPWLSRLVVPFAPHGSKEQRAGLAAVYCRRGDVWLPAPGPAAPWLQTFEGELWAFPAGHYKDQVDSFTQLTLYLSGYLQSGYETRRRAIDRLTPAGAGQAA